MTGKYDIEVYNNRVHYFLTVKRNITVIQGNSATGKTELIRLINDNIVNGNSSGITVKCEVTCRVLTADDWDIRLSAMRKSIIFIDETAAFIKTQKFAEMVRGSDNYFVIVTRDALSQLPYSIDEIYGLKNVSESSKYKTYKKVYNEMYKIYNFHSFENFIPTKVITEDSNSGYECFNRIYPDICISAGGKTKVYKLLRDLQNEKTIIIVDGAAFGSEIEKLYKFITLFAGNFILFAPESFEYLLLKSGIVSVSQSIMDETFNHADSTLYLSWEEFYTDYLVKLTRGTVFQYNKSKLKETYLSAGALDKIKNQLPEQIRTFS